MQTSPFSDRRKFLKSAAALALLPGLASATQLALPEEKELIITDIHVDIVQVNHRGNWVFIELQTNKGISGMGEASQGVKAITSAEQQQIRNEINNFFAFVKGQPAFDIEAYRIKGLEAAAASHVASTAFSGIEQALWDIKGKALGVPVYTLLGGKVHDRIRVYANINRATNVWDAQGRRPASAFQQNAEQALKLGFRAIKLAPFDDMKALPSTPQQIQADVDHAISCIEAVRQTIGNDVDLLVDVHSHLDQALGIEVAQRLAPLCLYWLEEAVNPSKYLAETKAITATTDTPIAGGESIFGRQGFLPLINNQALDILMPDVKHCGGIQELRYIAALAEPSGIHIAPHNPSGPVATAATTQAVASIPNFSVIELAYGEVEWRADLLQPAETFQQGYIELSGLPGLGHTLNKSLIAKHR